MAEVLKMVGKTLSALIISERDGLLPKSLFTLSEMIAQKDLGNNPLIPHL